MPDISDEPDKVEWVEETPLALLVGKSEQEPSDSRCPLALGTCQDPGQSWHVLFQLTENFIMVVVVVIVALSFFPPCVGVHPHDHRIVVFLPQHHAAVWIQ